MMWWDKFGYPEWMFTRHGGDRWSIFSYWWIDPDKKQKLEEAKKDKNITLPIEEETIDYWNLIKN